MKGYYNGSGYFRSLVLGAAVLAGLLGIFWWLVGE